MCIHTPSFLVRNGRRACRTCHDERSQPGACRRARRVRRFVDTPPSATSGATSSWFPFLEQGWPREAAAPVVERCRYTSAVHVTADGRLRSWPGLSTTPRATSSAEAAQGTAGGRLAQLRWRRLLKERWGDASRNCVGGGCSRNGGGRLAQLRWRRLLKEGGGASRDFVVSRSLSRAGPAKRRRPSSKGADGRQQSWSRLMVVLRSWPGPFDDASRDSVERRLLKERWGRLARLRRRRLLKERRGDSRNCVGGGYSRNGGDASRDSVERRLLKERGCRLAWLRRQGLVKNREAWAPSSSGARGRAAWRVHSSTRSAAGASIGASLGHGRSLLGKRSVGRCICGRGGDHRRGACAEGSWGGSGSWPQPYGGFGGRDGVLSTMPRATTSCFPFLEQGRPAKPWRPSSKGLGVVRGRGHSLTVVCGCGQAFRRRLATTSSGGCSRNGGGLA